MKPRGDAVKPLRVFRTRYIVASAVVLTACAPQKPGTGRLRASEASAQAVLEVGSEKFTVRDVEARFDALRAFPGAKADNGQLAVVAQFELLADEAERRGYGDDPRVVNAVKDEVSAQAKLAAQRGDRPAKARAPQNIEADRAAIQRAFDVGATRRKL